MRVAGDCVTAASNEEVEIRAAIGLQHMLGVQTQQVTARSSFAFTGVDAQTAIILGYPDRAQAMPATSMEAQLGNRAAIVGTQARLDIDGTWYRPASFTVTKRTGETERFDYPDAGNGLRHEAGEVASCAPPACWRALPSPGMRRCRSWRPWMRSGGPSG